MKKLNILLIEDHPIIIEAIKSRFPKSEYNFDSCLGKNDTLSLLKTKNYQVIISDIRLKNGSTAFEIFNEENTKNLHLIIYTSYANQWLFTKLKRNKIQPVCIMEKTEMPAWYELVQKIVSGKKCFSNSAFNARQLFNQNMTLQEISTISERKWQVLNLLIQGKSDKEIADLCFISKYTANDHRKYFYKLLEVKDASSLILKFRDFGYHDIETS